ncbi:MAG: ABC transporter substrate-binding protein [Thermoanaerobaculia bacterium]
MPRAVAGLARSRYHGLLLTVLIVAASCRGTDAPDAPRDTLIIGLDSAWTHLDPRLGTSVSSGRAFELMLNGLVKKDVNGNFIPDLATSWEMLDQGARYRFHLRSGVRFHDGRELTSRDVAWTFNSMVDGTVVSPKRGGFPQLERVATVDDVTVDFVLSEPWGALLDNVTCFLGIVPEGTLPDDFNRKPIGSGPFQLVERVSDRLTFEAFEGYWGERPKIRTVVLREVPDATVRALELQKGSLHLVVNGLPPDVVAKFREDPRFTVQVDPGSTYHYLGLNLDDPVLSNRSVRRALAHAIDRPRLLRTLYRGLGVLTETVMRPGHWARNDDLVPIRYDPALAAQLLDNAGFPDPDGSGPRPRFSLTYKTSTDETGVLQAQIIQSMLAEVGIDVEVRSYEFATFYSDVKRGNFQLFSLRWVGIVDPDIYSLILHSKRIPPAGANRGRYRNPEFDREIELGAGLVEREARRPHYLRAQEILHEDLPYISIRIKSNDAVMPCALEGYRNYPTGEFYGLPEVHWSERSPACAPDNA